MAVWVSADIPGQTQEGYDSMMGVLEPLLRQAKGFIAHGAGPGINDWRVFEIWETQHDATQFFATYIQPNLPDGVKPQRVLIELHRFVQA